MELAGQLSLLFTRICPFLLSLEEMSSYVATLIDLRPPPQSHSNATNPGIPIISSQRWAGLSQLIYALLCAVVTVYPCQACPGYPEVILVHCLA